MPPRGTRLIVAAVAAIAAATAAGCRRQPIADTPGRDATATDASTTGERPGPTVDAGQEVAPDLIGIADAADAPASDAPAEISTGDADDANDDRSVVDAPADLTPADTPADMNTLDLAPDTTSPDHTAADASDVRPDEQPCGPAGLICRPYRCDLALGQCKTTCASDDDCIGRPCTRGSCAFDLPAPCASGAECVSGFCAQGACCSTACNRTCFSCALPGTRGSCVPVPLGNPDPSGSCPNGYTCNGRGECIPPACAVDTDCGRYHRCPNGRCVPCQATCVNNADCIPGAICFDQNGCTYCGFADGGAGS